jgi:chromosome condensin MukBEF complex kleisin-like MukF subunit
MTDIVDAIADKLLEDHMALMNECEALRQRVAELENLYRLMTTAMDHKQSELAASQEAERAMAVHGVTLTKQVADLQQVCRDAYEIYAGSEGFPAPTTASEAYLYQQIHLMKDEIARGLK